MSRSVFPDGVDTFVELFDLPYDKMAKANRLTQLKMKQVLNNDEQSEVISLTAELKEYMITPETWNKFQDALYAVEKFFHENVQGFIEKKQEIWNSYVNQLELRGVWQSGTAYKLHNFVIGQDGDLYICLKDHTASGSNKPVPSSNAFWRKLSRKGDKGDVGLTGILRGDWNSSTQYAMGDAVSFGRVEDNIPVVYIALRANTGKNPSENPSDWLLYEKVYAGATVPTGYGVGMHFIQFTN